MYRGNQPNVLSQLEEILGEYTAMKKTARYDDLSDLGYQNAFAFTGRARSAIERIGGVTSAYTKQVEDILRKQNTHDYERLQMIMGVVQSLRDDVKAGYTLSFAEMIHGEVLADLLDMATHLRNEGYKDAAAVIAGGTLEAHLRQLCLKYGVDLEYPTANGDLRIKTADRMNADLAKASAYSLLDQKNVTAWLALRNSAAHAHYSEYTADQVALLVDSVRDFITRNPA